MTLTTRLRSTFALIVTLHMAVLFSAGPAQAQTPPRPAVDVRHLSDMWQGAIPGDFNRDGRIDMIAGAEGDRRDPQSFGRILVRFGNGDGSFAPALVPDFTGKPVATGDIDRDGALDVIIIGEAGALSILQGSGFGTFESQIPLDTVDDFRFALLVDLTGDRFPDLVLGHGTTVEVRPGDGDFEFDTPMVLPPGNDSGPSFGMAINLNGDDRPDLAIAQAHGSVFLYINRGGLLFNLSELPVADDGIFGMAAADLDRDGDQDLIVPHTHQVEVAWDFSSIEVFPGRGDGTFGPPTSYSTGLAGPMTAATGDFNRDGIVDVAIGSRSFGWDDIADFRPYCDSIAIFPGRGNGSLAPPALFRLDNFPVTPGPSFGFYVDTHESLTTADINNDGHLDLVASAGAVLLNRAPAANRPPTADAGPDRFVDARHIAILSVTTRDPDWDWLRVEWRDETRIVGLQPQIEYFTFERHALTVTVTDGRGGVATDTVVVDGNIESLFFVDVQSPRGGDSFASGADVPITWDAFNDFPFDHFRISVSSDNFATRRVLHNAVPSNEREFTWQNAGAAATAWRVRIDAFDESNRLLASDTSDAFTIRPPVAGALPWPWRDTPVGAEVPSGQASFSSGTFTMRGGGADVWGRADAFHFVYQPVDGDFTFTARVASVAGGEPWTKVGIMVRESLSANAAHHFLLATIGNGLAYQRRLVAGGASAHTSVGEGGAPVVFRFTRVAGILSMQMAPDLNTPFETVASVGMVGPVLIGMVTSSHTTSQLATATFDDVQVAGGLEQPLWTNLDVGAVGAPGSAREQSGRWTVTGSGADVWGTADAFHYVRRGVVGDFEFTARVAAVQNIHRWTKAGLMMREQIGASARHAFVLATPTTVKGVAFQRRTSESGETIGTAGPSIAPPMYLKLIRTGDIVSAYYRRSLSDTWTLLGQETYPDLRVVVDVGFAVSSHIDGRLAAATFDQISLSHFRPLRSQDIGDVGLPGSTTGDPLNVELRASGTDIWGTADAFRYASESITADATITARVSSIDGPHAWTKAGVMMRSAMNPPSAYAMVMVTPGKGIAFQARRVVGQRAVQIAVVPGVAPAWVRLTRSGDWSRATYTGSFSHDGITWTTLGSVDVQFNTNGFAGLALTSHDNSALATATFGNVSLVEHEP